MKTCILLLLMLTQIFLFGQSHKLLKNIASGDDYGIPAKTQATNWNGKSYFISTPTPSQDTRIWSTDGTTAHTVEVLTSDYPEINFLTSIDNGLIFEAWEGNNPAIYRSNGTQSGTSVLMAFATQEVVFLKRLNNTKVIFITENFAGDSTFLWSTDGTIPGTISLGTYKIKYGFLKTSYYKNYFVFTEKSTNFTLFNPVITDGTPEGTSTVEDFINGIVPGGVTAVDAAVGTTDFLFIKTATGGKVFNGQTVSNFGLSGSYNHGFKLGHLNMVISEFHIMVYDSIDGTSKQLPFDPYYYSEPVSNNEKVFFHSTDGYVYESDGTTAGTKKISSKTTGEFNFSPYLFATQTHVLYTSELTSNTELWIIDLATSTDSLFSEIKQAGNPVLSPYVFSTGDYLVYPKYTSAEGRELWVYEGLPTATKDVIPTAQITVSPNPADQELIISFGGEIPWKSVLSIMNVAGQIVSKSSIVSDRLEIDVHNLISGEYFLQIYNGNRIQYAGSFFKK